MHHYLSALMIFCYISRYYTRKKRGKRREISPLGVGFESHPPHQRCHPLLYRLSPETAAFVGIFDVFVSFIDRFAFFISGSTNLMSIFSFSALCTVNIQFSCTHRPMSHSARARCVVSRQDPRYVPLDSFDHRGEDHPVVPPAKEIRETRSEATGDGSDDRAEGEGRGHNYRARATERQRT